MSGYTVLAQVLTSFSMGVLFSSLGQSVGSLVVFVILYEIVVYLYMRKHRWSCMPRLYISISYIAGWLMAKSVYYEPISFINAEADCDRLGVQALCS